MTEKSTQREASRDARVEIRLGGEPIKTMLEILGKLQRNDSVEIVNSDQTRSVSKADVEAWMTSLKTRGGTAKLHQPSLGEDIYGSFIRAQEQEPSLALSAVTIEIPTGTSALDALIKMVSAIVYQTDSSYIVGRAVTAISGGSTSLYLTDTEVGEKLNHILR